MLVLAIAPSISLPFFFFLFVSLLLISLQFSVLHWYLVGRLGWLCCCLLELSVIEVKVRNLYQYYLDRIIYLILILKAQCTEQRVNNITKLYCRSVDTPE